MILFIGLEFVDSLKYLWGCFRLYEIIDKVGYFIYWFIINGNIGYSFFFLGYIGNGVFLMFIVFYFKKLCI